MAAVGLLVDVAVGEGELLADGEAVTVSLALADAEREADAASVAVTLDEMLVLSVAVVLCVGDAESDVERVAVALVETGLCSSTSDARRAIQQGGVAINNQAVTGENDLVGDRTLAGGVSILRRGKKTLAALVIGN